MNPLVRFVLLPAMRAIGKAPHVNTFGRAGLEQLTNGAGFDVLATETHASQGKDNRPYIVASK